MPGTKYLHVYWPPPVRMSEVFRQRKGEGRVLVCGKGEKFLASDSEAVLVKTLFEYIFASGPESQLVAI